MKKTLIIGGSRFVGPELIKKLLKDNHKVTIFNRGNSYGWNIPKGVIHIQGDRSKKEDIQKLKETKYDFIYDMCCFDKEDAKLLLQELKPKGHIIFFSSAAVYKKSTIYPFDEESELGEWDTFGDYGPRKAALEKLYITYCKKNGNKLTILRPTYLLGENNYFDRENYYFSRILKNKPILMPGTGESLLQFGFLEDISEAFFRIPKKQIVQIEKVNIGGNDLISIKNFVLLCGEIAGEKPKIVNIPNGKFNIIEDSFYDDLYPFPNITFITVNKKMVDTYGITPTKLVSGLKSLYKLWHKTWNGEVKQYELEKELLKKMHVL